MVQYPKIQCLMTRFPVELSKNCHFVIGAFQTHPNLKNMPRSSQVPFHPKLIKSQFGDAPVQAWALALQSMSWRSAWDDSEISRPLIQASIYVYTYIYTYIYIYSHNYISLYSVCIFSAWQCMKLNSKYNLECII